MSEKNTYKLNKLIQRANELDEAIIQNLKKIGFEITPHKTVEV